MIRRATLLSFCALAVSLGLIPTVSGCSLLQSGCTAAAPTLAAADVYLTDAKVWVEKAAAVATTDEQREIVTEARTALDLADKAITAARGSCEAVEIKSVFAAFVAIWPLVSPLLATTGSAVGTVHGPLVMEVAR